MTRLERERERERRERGREGGREESVWSGASRSLQIGNFACENEPRASDREGKEEEEEEWKEREDVSGLVTGRD